MVSSVFKLFRRPAGILPLALAAVLAACNGGGDNGEPGPTPTPEWPPITATGAVAYITPENDLAVMNPDGSDQRRLTELGTVKAFAWSPDGAFIAVEHGPGVLSNLLVIREDGSAVFEREGASEPLWAPVDNLLAVARDGNVEVLGPDGAERVVIPGAVRPEWSPDGSSLAVVRLDSEGNGVPIIVELATGEESPLSPEIESHEPIYALAWHPAGNVIAYRDSLYEPGTAVRVPLPGVAALWSPDGRTLLVTGDPEPAERATNGLLLDATQEFRQIIGLFIRDSAEGMPAWLFVRRFTDWTPDGRHMVYMDNLPERARFRLYDTVEVGQRIYRDIAGERPDISPDGQTSVFMYEGQVWTFPLDASTLHAVAEGGFPAWRPVEESE
jgi:Tol biopolymer transport system component